MKTGHGLSATIAGALAIACGFAFPAAHAQDAGMDHGAMNHGAWSYPTTGPRVTLFRAKPA